MTATTGRGARIKGAAFARQIRQHFEQLGHHTMARQAGEDGDDITLVGTPWLSIECKNHTRTDLPGWWNQAASQCRPGQIPVVIHKRFGRQAAGDQWVTLTVDTLNQLIERTQR